MIQGSAFEPALGRLRWSSNARTRVHSRQARAYDRAMGFLDNVKKNLGLGGKDHGGKDHGGEASAGRQAAEDSAAVEVSASDGEAAEAAAAQATEQQEAANRAAAEQAHQAGVEPQDPEVRPEARETAATAAAEAGQQGPVAPQVTEVVVEPGDTMRGIAAQFGVDLGALIATNSDTVPNPDAIYPGQVLRLP